MPIDWESFNRNVIFTLQDLIRFDTTNPPGNETPCAEYIRARLAAEGIQGLVLESRPGRGNLVARLPGDGSQRPLLLMCHLDVVLAEADHWTHPPFSPEIHKGYLWGRGTTDMKGMAAIWVEVLLQLKRLNLALKRDVILVGSADEEAGGVYGLSWLAQNHFDLIDAEYAINEGAGMGTNYGKHWLFTCQTGEKGLCGLRLRANGQPGHASIPKDGTAVSRLAGAVDRLAHARLPLHIVPTVEGFIHALAESMDPAEAQNTLDLLNPDREAEAMACFPDPETRATLYAMLHNTAVPTILRAGKKINVIPSVAEAEVDCRLLPGQTAADLIAEIQAHVGRDIEIEVMYTNPGTENAFNTPLFHTIDRVMGQIIPEARVSPYLLPAATDARHLLRHGVKTYGFWPTMEIPGEPGAFAMAHAHDERISLENLSLGTRALWEIVSQFCTE